MSWRLPVELFISILPYVGESDTLLPEDEWTKLASPVLSPAEIEEAKARTRADLARCSLVHSTWAVLAKPILYQRITMMPAEKLHRVTSLLKEREDLAKLVREICLNFQVDEWQGEVEVKYYEMVSAIQLIVMTEWKEDVSIEFVGHESLLHSRIWLMSLPLRGGGVRSLTLNKIGFSHFDFIHIPAASFGSMTQLSVKDAQIPFQIFDSLISAPQLQSLSMEGIQFVEVDDERLTDLVEDLLPRLETLNIGPGIGLPWVWLSGLAEFGGPLLTSLSIPFEGRPIIPLLSTATPILQTLHFYLDYSDLGGEDLEALMGALVEALKPPHLSTLSKMEFELRGEPFITGRDLFYDHAQELTILLRSRDTTLNVERFEGAELTLENLQSYPPPERLQLLGEFLYLKIHPILPLLAGKITGMMLDMEKKFVLEEMKFALELLRDPWSLHKKLVEALATLRHHHSSTEYTGPEDNTARDALSTLLAKMTRQRRLRLFGEIMYSHLVTGVFSQDQKRILFKFSPKLSSRIAGILLDNSEDEILRLIGDMSWLEIVVEEAKIIIEVIDAEREDDLLEQLSTSDDGVVQVKNVLPLPFRV